MKTLPPAILLMGPTASGKTDLALNLCQQFPVEIISVDSALVYRDMNIGTAKPDAATLAQFPHALVDILDPTEAYSAANFCHDAQQEMAKITQRGNIPLLVGGTMLYFKALVEGLSDLPESDPETRKQVDQEIAEFGIQHLHQQLQKIDPESAARLRPTDTQRVQRAMEIYRISGKTMTELLAQQKSYQLDYQLLSIALIPENRKQLHQRINQRFSKMLAQGLLEEVQQLQKKYQLTPNHPSMRCVGYRQSLQYLNQEINQDTLIETGQAATRQLAKRQLTWLRSMPNIQIFDSLQAGITEHIDQTVREFIDLNLN